MNSSYWPSTENIHVCMQKEAEVLPAKVLLAVHHPMHLAKRSVDGRQVGENLSEHDLLEAVITIDRPIPIIGAAGSGKSHLIRWLDAQLRTNKESSNWHVVRIHKNSSLRGSLELLLEGLSGETFDTLRSSIKTVGEKLDVQEVAHHLVVFVASLIESRYRSAEERYQQIRETNAELDEDEKEELQRLKRHAGPECLPALIKDQNFNKLLVGEGCCFYQIAKHLTEGSTNEEIEEDRFAVQEGDFKFEAIGDLGRHARDYIQQKSIFTRQESKLEAIELLNECLFEAQQKAFQQFFNFSPGDFVDLFQEIRRALKREEKILCVLVEDLRQISAIEQYLMDALSQEAGELGSEELCSLHSAIAVTEGYAGYLTRRDTVVTRAGAEWIVSKTFDDENSMHDSIQNFCGRYLNAARHDLEDLMDDVTSKDNSEAWRVIWESEDDTERSIAATFGQSSLGFPLFPFNKHAIHVLAEKYCRTGVGLEFNPRKICHFILYSPLFNYRSSYQIGQFPPPLFEEIPCGTELASELHSSLRVDVDRVDSFAAVWGGRESRSVASLAANVAPEMAEEFGLNELAKLLTTTEPSKSARPLPTNTPAVLPRQQVPAKIGQTVVVSKMEKIPSIVDGYFSSKQIPQEQANWIRQALVERIEQATHLAQWTGLTKWPTLSKRGQPFVKVNYNSNNPVHYLFEFGSEKDFGNSTSSLPYREFLIALLRHKEIGGNWDYGKGYTDCVTYHNFLDRWIEESRAVDILAETREDMIRKHLEDALTIAPVFTPSISNASSIEKIDALVEHSSIPDTPHAKFDGIRERIPVTKITEWDEEFENLFGQWEKIQSQWLDNYSISRYGIEGDLVKKQLHGVSGKNLPGRVNSAIRKARDKIFNQLDGLELLNGCSSRDEFEDWFESLAKVIEKVRSDAQWMQMPDKYTARKTLNKIKKVQDDSEVWPSIKPLLSVLEKFEPIKMLGVLQQLDRNRALIVSECLVIWKTYYDGNLTRLENENQGHGADERLKTEREGKKIIGNLSELIRSISGRDDAVAK